MESGRYRSDLRARNEGTRALNPTIRSSALEALPELVTALLEHRENRFLLLRHGQHLGAIALVARIGEALADIADLRSELGDLTLDAFELGAHVDLRFIGRHTVEYAPFGLLGNPATAAGSPAGTPICTLSPQAREDSSTAGPYPLCVTSVAPSARDGLVRTVVVIEDEQPIAQAVAARLRSEGYAVDIAADGPSGVALCARAKPDLVVLDLMLPGLDGIEVCKRIQSERPVPVLMLTARDGESDLLVGLAVGADDYMTKPFSMRELIARVHALLRRAERTTEAPVQPVVRIGDVELDATTRRVRVGSELVHLTPIEFDLVHYLAARPGRVSTREELLAQVWGYDVPSGARTVDSHIRTIRRKRGSTIVRTGHGVGSAIEEAHACA
jgi:DNA-binding response OmpR family regulator